MKVLDKIENGLLALGMFMMVAVVFVNIVLRATGVGGISFAEEITNAVFILVTLLGAAVAARRKGHMGFTLLQDSVGPKFRSVLILFSDIVCLIFSVLLLFYGIKMVQGEILSGQTTPALGIPEAVYGSFVPIGALFMTIRYAHNVVKFFNGTRENVTDNVEKIA